MSVLQDYCDVEAELDRYELEMKETKKVLDQVELENVGLKAENEQLRNENERRMVMDPITYM